MTARLIPRDIPAVEVPLGVRMEIVFMDGNQQYIHIWPIIVEEADTMGWQILMQRWFIVKPGHQCWDAFQKLIPVSEDAPVPAQWKFSKALRDWGTDEVRYHNLQWSYTFSTTEGGILGTPVYYNANMLPELGRQR